jgi:ribosomal protein S18 acetylase RimI-like enzyme
MIACLDVTEIDDLQEALPRLAHVPLAHLQRLNSDQRCCYWLDKIKQSLRNESSIAFRSVVSGTINGFVVYNESPWDSEITGRRIGTVEHLAVARGDPAATETLHELIDQLTRIVGERGAECVVCKVDCNELPVVHALEQHGFLLMDTLQDFVFDFARIPIEEINPAQRDKQLTIRRADPSDFAAVMGVSERAFANYFGRYHADPQMPPGTPTKIYTEWVRAAFDGWADWILVAAVDGRIAGYGLWRKPLEAEEKNSLRVAHYDLAAVDPEFQSRGLYTALALDGMYVAHDYAQYLVGPVHVSHYPVQHNLQKLGWRISGARHSFHNWLRP